MINASPEPFSNWGVSLTEDALVLAGIWFAIQHPLLFLAAFAAFVLLMIWLLPRLWRGALAVVRRVRPA
jgi:ABC-type multidrug transport system permease subunit